MSRIARLYAPSALGLTAGAVGGGMIWALQSWGPSLNASEWAAWVQAVGSVVAILASSALAIWVPIRMRRLDERARVQHALHNAIIAHGLTVAAWAGLEQIIRDREFYPQTPSTLGDGIATARAAAAQVPHSAMLGTALMCVTRCTSALQTLDTAMSEFLKAKDPYVAAARFEFALMLQQLEESGALLELMKPGEVDGHWFIWSPEDELPDGVKVRW